jgi:GNAT superfamily N-acetyltransferase
MPFDIRSLLPDDTNAVEQLLNMNATDTYPYGPVTDLQFDELLATESDWMADCVTLGAFSGTELLAAAKIGRNPVEGEPRDFRNMLPGDGVIDWLLLSDEDAADALLDFAAPTLGERRYAFPEKGGLRPFAPFHTGMLPIQRKPITAFFERRGWEQPVGETWGPQERIAYRYDFAGPVEVPSLPQGLRMKKDTDLEIETNNGAPVGASSISNGMLRGEKLLDAVYVGWLGVNEEWRGQGLGRILLTMQLKKAYEMGANRVYLTTHAGKPAWKLYERMGFREVMRMKSWFKEIQP